MIDEVARPADDAPGDRPYPQEPGYWRDRLAAYAEPRFGRSVLDVSTSVVPYLGISVGMYLLIAISPWLALALAPVSAIFLVRTFMVFHDCTHGSFSPMRQVNRWLGVATGIIVLTPFARWRHEHAVHHATAGDLDKRGTGDLPTLTVDEYHARSRRGRLAYRLFRSPPIMFGLGPIIAMIITPRLVGADVPRRLRHSVLATDLVLVLIFGGLCWALGPAAVFLVWTPAALLAGAVGIWLFYVQHQFEEVYWERSGDWCYADAALQGSSYLKLPRPLQFATANIGYHHIHHLSVRIPNYNLQRAHDENPVFHSVPVLTLMDGMRATRLKLWDESRGRLVTFAEARAFSGG